MSSAPTRQLVVLQVTNYDDIRVMLGREAADDAVRVVREQAIACANAVREGSDIQRDHLQGLRPNVLLMGLDQLTREELLNCVQRMSQAFGAQALGAQALETQVPGAAPHSASTIKPQVTIGVMSDRANREAVGNLAMALLTYMHHTGSAVTFLTGDELDLWQQLESASFDFVSFDQLQNVDPFTGMLRPARFATLLQQALEWPSLAPDTCVILYFDLDEFKSFNRVFGRHTGDELLKFIADQLRTSFPGDLMSHIAIDRFVVATKAHNYEETCVRIHEEVRDFSPVFAPQLKCGAYMPRFGERDANIAMDYAKVACERIKGLFDTVLFKFDNELYERVAMSQYVAHHVEKAVAEGWIRPFYQPVVDAKTGVVCGWEALCRWVDPVQGVLSPAVFIPVLEDTHLIHKIDVCVVSQVCRDIAKNLQMGRPVVPVSINLSRLDFQLCDIYEVITGFCDKWNLPHELLVIEVTESALSGKGTFLREQMDRFRASGFEVWMDDFGSGYSTLNLLKDYEFDVLKVDMEFLNGMEESARSQTIVAAVIALARELNLRTLVEGVRSETQRDYLCSLGCDMLQGYLFDIPRATNDPLFRRGLKFA